MVRTTTRVAIREEPMQALEAHASVPIAFRVERTWRPRAAPVADDAAWVEDVCAAPYVKDYDLSEGNHPTDWPLRFDTRRWGLLSAWRGARRVGGAVLAHATPGLELLEGRDDRLLLWDLRVAPEQRGRGVGTALFDAARSWGRERGCIELQVETQNINLPACHFYRARGCQLAAVDPAAYPHLPHEIQLIWRLDLR